MSFEVKSKIQEIYEQGYCLLPAHCPPEECRALSNAMNALWQKNGQPSLEDWGMGIHPVFEQLPEIAPIIADAGVLEVVAGALRDTPRLRHSGARLSRVSAGGSNPALAMDWHNHYSHGQEAWPEDNLHKRDRIERLLTGVYTDGSNAEVGRLIVLPRHLNDPLAAPLGGLREDWPGQIEVEAPPGSVMIFDTALWHTARLGTSSQMRHLIGGVYQGWHDLRPHTDDNVHGTPELARVVEQYPTLQALLYDPNAKSFAGAAG